MNIYNFTSNIIFIIFSIISQNLYLYFLYFLLKKGSASCISFIINVHSLQIKDSIVNKKLYLIFSFFAVLLCQSIWTFYRNSKYVLFTWLTNKNNFIVTLGEKKYFRTTCTRMHRDTSRKQQQQQQRHLTRLDSFNCRTGTIVALIIQGSTL